MHVPAIIEHFPYLGLFALLLLGGLGLPFPEDATLIVCGFLIATDVVKPVPAILVVYAGILVTDWGLYAVGKKYGRLVVSHRRFRTIPPAPPAGAPSASSQDCGGSPSIPADPAS
jgi:membrane protein DedA with SNARE-associated domain